MKKILLASTALVLSAGAAAAQAEVRFGGLARFGVLYDSGRVADPVDDRWLFVNRFRLQVDATRTTDTGLTFGARMRWQADNTTAGFQGNAVRFFARAEGLEVAFGNIFGVIDSLPNLYMPGVPSAGVGLIGNGFHNLAANTVSNGGVFGWTAYASGAAPLAVGSNGVEAIYTFGGFTIHAHAADDRRLGVIGTTPLVPGTDDTTVFVPVVDELGVPVLADDGVTPVVTPIVVPGTPGTGGDNIIGRTGSNSQAIGVRGTFNDIAFGIGYERWRRGTRDGDNILAATVGTNFGDGNVALGYARTNYNDVSASKWSLQGGWRFTPEMLTYGFVAHENNDIGITWGVGTSWSLGTGASLEAGYTRGKNADGSGRNIFSAGVFFSF